MTDLAAEGACSCPHGERSLGILHGINMGRGIVRLSTTSGCPVHDSCQHYAASARAKRWNGSWLYCPIHRTKACPS